MTQTRAATAVMNLRSKQELVRLLFEQGRRKGPNNHRILVDHSSYSYNDLKKAYLERIQVLHPDKRRKNDNLALPANDNTIVDSVPTLLNDTLTADTTDDSSEAFVQLQSAWENYDNAYKYIRQTNGTNISFESNFTMFGVGCSFSDTDSERDLRNEFMDQASKGWFAAGEVTSGEVNNNNDDNKTENDKSVPSSRLQQIRSSLPIIDQSDFIAINDNDPLNSDHTSTIKPNSNRRKFLVEDRKGSKT